VGDGSTAVAMAAEVLGSIADRRLYRTHLRQLFAHVERRSAHDVRRLAWHVDRLPQCASQALQGRRRGILHRFFVHDRRNVFEIAHERLVPTLRLIGICIFLWFNSIYGGSAAWANGSGSATGRWGGTASWNNGSGSAYGARGGSASWGGGFGSATGFRGGTASWGGGSGSYHGAFGRSGSWSRR
jgi:hypothetical protein